jgi:hypothetical protein
MSLARVATSATLALGILVASAASAEAPRRTLGGTYTSNWDDVTLEQDGNRIRGTYVCCGGGTIEGRIVEGRVIKYHWSEPHGAGEGEGVWTITPSGALEGTWGHGQSVDNGGPWNLTRKKTPAAIAQ